MKKIFYYKKVVFCLCLLIFSVLFAKNTKNQVHWSVSTPIDLKKTMSIVDISSFRGNLQAVRQLETMLMKEGFQIVVQPDPEILSVEGLKAKRKLEREQAEEARRKAEELANAQLTEEENSDQEDDDLTLETIEAKELEISGSETESQNGVQENTGKDKKVKQTKNTNEQAPKEKRQKTEKKQKKKSEIQIEQTETQNEQDPPFQPDLVIESKVEELEKSFYVLQITYKLYETHRDYAMIDATASDQQISAVGGYARFSCEQLIVTVIDTEKNRLAVFAFESHWFPQDLQKVFALFIQKLKTGTEVTAYR